MRSNDNLVYRFHDTQAGFEPDRPCTGDSKQHFYATLSSHVKSCLAFRDDWFKIQIQSPLVAAERSLRGMDGFGHVIQHDTFHFVYQWTLLKMEWRTSCMLFFCCGRSLSSETNYVDTFLSF